MYVNDEVYSERMQELERLRGENHVLKKKVDDVSLLVAGAIRQGFSNGTQKEALTYAFCKLIEETSERIALLKAHIQPRGYRSRVALQKPPDPIPPEEGYFFR